jgi:hypothetical protein
MTFTMEDFQRQYVKDHFAKLTPQERLEVLQSLRRRSSKRYYRRCHRRSSKRCCRRYRRRHALPACPRNRSASTWTS